MVRRLMGCPLHIHRYRKGEISPYWFLLSIPNAFYWVNSATTNAVLAGRTWRCTDQTGFAPGRCSGDRILSAYAYPTSHEFPGQVVASFTAVVLLLALMVWWFYIKRKPARWTDIDVPHAQSSFTEDDIVSTMMMPNEEGQEGWPVAKLFSDKTQTSVV